ncbi:hsp70-interacting protein, isoform CRA_b [Rattus norvegicus]|uniref:Hsp70-interacting protein, isoform CRA_b n=1 Tax=Rattus norvegicus TaxID=10116 RepID=A6KNM7_RAT|nr:hsp70-interacting protein, isoform CRA_b [Rattus norvegicus]
MRSTRRSWSSVKSCYRPVSPALRMTAWIGETRRLLAFSPWEPQASCLPPSQAPSPKGLPGLVWACAWACQPISRQPPGGVAEKGAGPLEPLPCFLSFMSTLLFK